MRSIQGAVLISLYIFAAGCGESRVQQGPMGAVPVTVVEVQKRDVPIFTEFVGEVRGLYDIPIRARVDGYLEERHFQEGTPVDKGQLLYVIDSQPYEAEVASRNSDVAEARTNLVRAEADLNRIRPLAEKNAVSQSDLDAAIAEHGAAEASLEAAIANLELAKINLGYTRISSPIDGVIGKTKAKRGEYVGKDPNPVILNTVSRIDTILVQFFITESQYLEIVREYNVTLDSLGRETVRERRERNPNIELILTDGSIHDYKGLVDFIDREVDPTTGSILVQASFPNPKGIIRPGQFAKAKIEMKSIKDGKIIPIRAMLHVQGKNYVYLLNDSNTVHVSEVNVQGSYGDMALVSGELDHGDRIVLDGLQKIRSGVEVNPEKVEFRSQSNKLPE